MQKEAAAKAKQVEAKAEEEEEWEYGEYDEEDDEGAEESEDADEVVKLAEGEIDPKLKVKYSFLFKERDQMLPSERRWKWVKKECYPEELAELIERLSKKKTKQSKEEKKKNQKVAADEEEEGDQYIT